MLKRLYVNNYRCMVNFEITFDNLTLLTGPNGGGKSSLLDVMYGIRRLIVDNANAGEVFPSEDITAWVNKAEQSFELDVLGKAGLFSYRLVISHTLDRKKQRIDNELLLLDDKPLFEFNQGQVQLYHDDHEKGPAYDYNWSASALANILPRRDNTKLTWFKEWVESLYIISLEPRVMTSVAKEESIWLNRNGSNFSSWCRHLIQEHHDIFTQLQAQLSGIIPGFQAFKLVQSDEHRVFKVGFIGSEDNKRSAIWLKFTQLSDGQRVMIVLYTLLHAIQALKLTVFLDEPENYVALREIQPWLIELYDACGEGFPQAILISHHPELIDYLGPECGKWIEQDPLGPSRVKQMSKQPEPADKETARGLKLSELVARGWEQ